MDAYRPVDLSLMKDHLISHGFTAKDVPTIKNILNDLDILNGDDLLKELSPLGFVVDQADDATVAVDDIMGWNENNLNVLDILNDEDLLQELSSLGFIMDQADATTLAVPTVDVHSGYGNSIEVLDIPAGEDLFQELRPLGFIVDQDDSPTAAVNKTGGWSNEES